MAEELRLDERRRHRREIEPGKQRRRDGRETVGALIEWDVTRESDGAGDELLASAGRAEDQGRHVAHPLVERTLIPAEIA